MEESGFIETEVIETTQSKEAISIAEHLAKEKQVVIAIGGDGTCNEVLNGWHQAENPNCAFGIIPAGTGNDFARMLEPFDPEQFVRAIEQLDLELIDYGVAVFASGEKAFLNIADLGFGAKVVEMMDRQRKSGIKGKMSYSMAIVRTFLAYRKRTVEFKWKGDSFKGKLLLAAFCNGQQFGHGLTIYPFGGLNSGELGITIVGNVSLSTYVSKLGHLKKGKPIEHPELTYASTTEIEFVEVPETFFMEFDGEICRERIQSLRVCAAQLPLIHGSR